MKKIIIVLSLSFSLLGTSCQQTSKIKTDISSDKITDTEIENSLFDLRQGLMKKDSTKFKDRWSYICDNDSIVIGFLLKNKDNTAKVDWGIVPKPTKQSIIPTYFNDLNNANFSALYLICAIYYKNYYFCTSPIVYDNNSIIYDEKEKKYIKSENSLINSSSSEDEINACWSSISKWAKLNKSDRKLSRPLSFSEMFFIGEPGATITN